MTTTAELTAQAQQAIRADVEAGLIPEGVSSFAELHDHVDANDYVRTLENEDGTADYDAVNDIESALNRWLASGGHRIGARAMPTVARTVRIADELWDEAARIAADRGENLSTIMRTALARYVKRHTAAGGR